MAAATTLPRSDARPGRRLHGGPVLALVVFDVAFAGLLFAIVRRYYQTHLPHYDSIGGLTLVYQTINRAQQQGLGDALAYGSGISISWLYPLAGLLLAWLPVRTPEYVIPLNVLLLMVAQLAIVQFGRVVGWDPRRTFLVGLLPLIPGMYFVWDGGLQDFRRDSHLTPLLTACLFLSLAYMLRPGRWSGIALGVVVGLTQWSRDNAAAPTLCILLPALAMAAGQARRLGLRRFADIAAPPTIAFLTLAVPYYAFTLPGTYYRYVYTVFGAGHERLPSLLYFTQAPYHVLLGTPPYHGSPELVTASAWTIVGGVLAVLLAMAGGLVAVRPSAARKGPLQLLVCAGLVTIAALILYSSLLLGLRAGGRGLALMPVGAGLVAVLAGLSELVAGTDRADRRRRAGTGALAVVAVLLLVASGVRMQAARTSPEDPARVAEVRAASRALGALADDRPTLVLWIDGFSRHHVNYYVTQAGGLTLAHRRGPDRDNQMALDLEQPYRPTLDAEHLREQLRIQIRRHFDLIVVSDQTWRYADGHVIQWPYHLAQPVVDELLADPAYVPIDRFAVQGVPFVVLEYRP